jgi:hypothetical protein
MFEIQQAIVEDPIAGMKFACNTSACKGACCTLAGGTGAPLLDEELDQLKHSFPTIRSSLSQEHLKTIEYYGLYEGEPGSYTTMCFNNRACVFVIYEEGIARCAFEKAFREGKLKWKKPLSCHLFPLRVDRGIMKRLRYERIAECDPALELGEQEHLYLHDFLREPLERAFGSSWYKDFQQTCLGAQNDPTSV